VGVVPVALAWGVVVVALAPRLPPTTLLAVGACALLVRAVLVGAPPMLSDDLFRYLWEGKVLNLGLDPFATAPAALPGIDDALRARVAHPEVPSIYPPLALWWFRGIALAGTPAAAQLAAALCDVALALAIAVTAGRRMGLIYALHPLPALESAVGAHLEIPAILLAVCAVLLARRARPFEAFVLATAGMLVKLFRLLLLPSLATLLPREHRMHTIGAGALLLVAAALPMLSISPALLEGWNTYTSTWEFNGFAYAFVEPLFGLAARPFLVAVGLQAILLAMAFRPHEPDRVWLVAGTAFVLLSPTVHPWYVLWALAPDLLLGRLRWAAAAVPMLASYLVLATFDPATGSWTEPAWLWWITWPPAIAVWAIVHVSARSEPRPIEEYPAQNSARNGSEAT
jgi:hypothetical protein